MPKGRVFTWVIVVVNVLFLIWIVTAIAGAGSTKDCGSLSASSCQDATAAGTAIGVGLIIVFLAFVDIVLGILWLVTRPKRRPCPVCGADVKPGVVVCPKCGHDFRAGQAAPPTPPPPPV